MAFGERLQEVRKRSGLTQEEFAEQLQVSRQSVSRWESGVSNSIRSHTNYEGPTHIRYEL